MTKNSSNEVDREVHDFGKPTDDLQMPRAKGSMLEENNPDAACLYERISYHRRTERKKSGVISICVDVGNKQKAALWLVIPGACIFVGRGDFGFFVRFESTASCINARRRAGPRRFCRLPACWRCRALVGTYLLFAAFCGTDCAVPCCACGRCIYTCSYIRQKAHQNPKMKKKALLLKMDEKGKKPAGKI